ncbi:MAG TPA: hypothetical protein VF807_15345, partial [Ktedonobacterales bacterium]
SAPAHVSGLSRFMATPSRRAADITGTFEATTHVRLPVVTRPIAPLPEPAPSALRIAMTSLRWALGGRLYAAEHRRSILSVLAALLIIGAFGLVSQASRLHTPAAQHLTSARAYHDLELDKAMGAPPSTVTPAPTATVHVVKPPAPPPPYNGPAVNTIGQPCHSDILWAPSLSNWTVPPDCYATIYSPDPSKYPPTIGAFGYCNWWVNVLNPNEPNLLYSSSYRHGSAPIPGAAIYFSGLVQGASGAGHFAQVVAIAPDHYWMLITEMNFGWRGGGFGRVDYRYAHVGPGVTFIYP